VLRVDDGCEDDESGCHYYLLSTAYQWVDLASSNHDIFVRSDKAKRVRLSMTNTAIHEVCDDAMTAGHTSLRNIGC
jgi:hypothetical protein